MANRKSLTPSVATYGDHEVIMPPHLLRKAITTGSPFDDPVGRAEAALQKLSSEYSTWMRAECDRLEAARHDVLQKGMNKQTYQHLFHAAHDIKGEATTFGYPAVVGVANSLCRLLEHTPDISRIPLTLVDQHVSAVRAIIRETARPDHSEMAETLTRRLRDVADEFLKHENRSRPEYLQNIFPPPLVPNGPAG